MNWDAIALAAIAATPPSLVGAAALWQSIKTHAVVNHKMDELLATTRTEAAATATLDEKAAEHVRKGEAAVLVAKEAKRNAT